MLPTGHGPSGTRINKSSVHLPLGLLMTYVPEQLNRSIPSEVRRHGLNLLHYHDQEPVTSKDAPPAVRRLLLPHG